MKNIHLFFVLITLQTLPAQAVHLKGLSSSDKKLLRSTIPVISRNKPKRITLDKAIIFLMKTGNYEGVEVHSFRDTYRIVGRPVKKRSSPYSLMVTNYFLMITF